MDVLLTAVPMYNEVIGITVSLYSVRAQRLVAKVLVLLLTPICYLQMQ